MWVSEDCTAKHRSGHVLPGPKPSEIPRFPTGSNPETFTVHTTSASLTQVPFSLHLLS